MCNVQYTLKQNIILVKISGVLMTDSIEKLTNDFQKLYTQHQNFIYDFNEVTMIDSSGLAYIVFCLKKVRANNGELKIIHLKEQPKLIFEITRINSIIEQFEDEEGALKSFLGKENTHESNNTNRIEITA